MQLNLTWFRGRISESQRNTTSKHLKILPPPLPSPGLLWVGLSSHFRSLNLGGYSWVSLTCGINININLYLFTAMYFIQITPYCKECVKTFQIINHINTQYIDIITMYRNGLQTKIGHYHSLTGTTPELPQFYLVESMLQKKNDHLCDCFMSN